MLKVDGFDEAIIGTASRCGSPDILAYNVDKIIEIIVRKDGMAIDDAWEYFEYNILSSYMGETTPIFIFPTI